jgi:isopentenyl-diphosphate delta-isomerase
MNREELIVLVDDAGHPIGTAEKLAGHNASTPLHLAFSCFIFSRTGRTVFVVTQGPAKRWKMQSEGG